MPPERRPLNRSDQTGPGRGKGRDSAAEMLLKPREVAKALGCSEWWVKEQARKRRIPFSWIGGSYRFTHEHLSEIIRLFEHRPTVAPVGATTPAQSLTRTARRSRVAPTPSQPVNRLKARPPRRATREPLPSPDR